MHGIVALLSDGAISFPLFAEGNVSESCNNALTMYFDETFPAGYCYESFVVVWRSEYLISLVRWREVFGTKQNDD